MTKLSFLYWLKDRIDDAYYETNPAKRYKLLEMIRDALVEEIARMEASYKTRSLLRRKK